MKKVHNFHNMGIWKAGIELADQIYDITKLFPQQEMFGLSSQMQRAAVSVPSNIAEGSGKSTDKEFAHFLDHAIGSLYELETQLLISFRRNYIAEEQYKLTNNNIITLQKRVFAFKDTLSLITM